jgi:hypothetical protein
MFVTAFTKACLLLICIRGLLITIRTHFLYGTFLGAFTKLRKATLNFVVSVRLSICMEQLGSHWVDFHDIL